MIDKSVDRYRKGKRTLEVTAALYSVPLDDAHDAGSDAIAAGRVALALLRAFPEELDIPLIDLHGRQEIWYAEHAGRFQDYIRSVKGDETYVADTAWPIRTPNHPTAYVDTQPIPGLPPRPGGNKRTLEIEAPVRFVEDVLLIEEIETVVLPPKPAPVKTAVMRVAAGIVSDSEGRTLLVRKRGTTAFMQAGGKIEPGESALAALTRELREEVGLELDPGLTEYLGSFRAVAANEPGMVDPSRGVRAHGRRGAATRTARSKNCCGSSSLSRRASSWPRSRGIRCCPYGRRGARRSSNADQ